MFVTRAQANARLSQGSNLLRDGSRVEEGTSDAVAESGEFIDPGSPEGTVDKADGSGSAMPLSRLDELLHPRRNGRAHYQGKLESQKAIAETAIVLSSERDAAKLFGLSQPQAHGYATGSINAEASARGIRKPALHEEVKRIRERLAVATGQKLESAIDAITPDKIAKIASPLKLASLSRDLAAVFDKVTAHDDVKEPNSQLHIYRPEIRQENTYQTIIVNTAPLQTESKE